jgi:hypothetical protein
MYTDSEMLVVGDTWSGSLSLLPYFHLEAGEKKKVSQMSPQPRLCIWITFPWLDVEWQWGGEVGAFSAPTQC